MTAAIDSEQGASTKSLRLAGWICLAVALAHVLSMLVAVVLVREGNLADFSPLRLLRFVPANLIVWRLGCLSAALASTSFVVLIIALSDLIERPLRAPLMAAVALTVIAAALDLNAEFSMMVLFSDLSQQLRGHGNFLQFETTQLAWMTLNQALTQSGLIANTLYSLAGSIVCLSALDSKAFPRLLAWLGLPVWFSNLNASLLIFSGILQWAIVLLMASTIAFVIWLTVLGFHFLNSARHGRSALGEHAAQHEQPIAP